MISSSIWLESRRESSIFIRKLTAAIVIASSVVPAHGENIKVATPSIETSVIKSVKMKKGDVNPDLYDKEENTLEKSVSGELGKRAESIQKAIAKARAEKARKAREAAERAAKKALEEKMKKDLLIAEKMAEKKAGKAKKALETPTVYVTEPDAKGEFDNTDIRQSIWNYLCASGFSEAQTAGIMGNIQAESSFSTTDTNGSSGAFGLFQWLGGRKQNLMAFAGDKYNTAKAQIDFMLTELDGSESKAKQAILLTQTPEDAAEVWDRLFERSEGTTTRRRQNYARAFYNTYAKNPKTDNNTKTA